MSRVMLLTVFAGLVLALPTFGQANDAARFRWQKGQVLTYKVEQSTTVNEVAKNADTNAEERSLIVTKLRLIKRWQVSDVDANGIATLTMTITALRMETKRGEEMPEVFDSAKPDPDHPETQAEMVKYINQPLTTVRIDSVGKLIEVKESKFGSATRLEADLPFKLILPNTTLTANQAWERAYTITLDRTGDKYEATQKYTCKGFNAGIAVIGVSTVVKEQPSVVGEQIPLLPFQPEGDLYFHTTTGRYIGARLKIQKELVNHQGEGSKYSFTSSYAEDAVDGQ